MKLTVDVLKLIRNECESVVYIKGQRYLGVAPDEASYPFITFTPIGVTPEWAFQKNYE